VRIAGGGILDTASGGDPPLCAYCIWRDTDIQWLAGWYRLSLQVQRVRDKGAVVTTTNVNYGVNFGQCKGYVLETKIQSRSAT